MKKAILIIMAVVLVIGLASCAAGPNEMVDTANEKGKVAGFLRGLLHGFIPPFTFIISPFTDKVIVY